MSRRDDIKNLIIKHERRLQKLEEQKAILGLQTPPHTLMEIEDVGGELERLHIALELLKNMSADVEKTFFEFEEKTEDKFNRQIEIYLDKFSLLHKQLEAWKNIHNLLHNTHFTFAFCRTFISKFSKPTQETIFYDFEVDWRTCRRSVLQLESWVDYIDQLQLEMGEILPKTRQGEGLEVSSNSRRTSILWNLAVEIDRTLNENNAIALSEQLSVFGDLVEKFLYGADKKMLEVIGEIKHLRRPSSV